MIDQDNISSKLIITPPIDSIDDSQDTDTAPKKKSLGKGTVNKDAQEQDDDDIDLAKIIKEQATEDEAPQSSKFTLRKILGGDILNTSTIKKQIWLFLIITLAMIVSIANRYACQNDLIEIDTLNKELQDAKYKALSSSSDLTERSRESNVLDELKNNKDSTIRIATQPPYIINVPAQ